METDESMFVKSFARQKLTTYDGVLWTFYDCSSKMTPKDAEPLICLPSTSGTARMFHKQALALVALGYRVLTIDLPIVWTHEQWMHSFERFLETLNLERIHIYGISLGAYLAQRYCAEYPRRVISLALTNGFCDTRVFQGNATCIKMFGYLPEFMLKQYILDQFPSKNKKEAVIAESIDYMKQQLASLTREQVASRLTLNCLSTHSDWKVPLQHHAVTMIDSYFGGTLPIKLREQMNDRYPQSRKALIKDSADFPFFSHPKEVVLYLQVHLTSNGFIVNRRGP